MAFMFQNPARTAANSKRSGGLYANPYGAAARRSYDSVDGWTDRVAGARLDPVKTGVVRVDEANASCDPYRAPHRSREANSHGAPPGNTPKGARGGASSILPPRPSPSGRGVSLARLVF